MSDFGPKITIKIVESLRDDIYAGKLKSGTEIKASVVNALFFFPSVGLHLVDALQNGVQFRILGPKIFNPSYRHVL